MKSPFAFGLGVASGAIIASALLCFSLSRDRVTKEAEVATLRDGLSSAQKAAARDREALHDKLQEIQALREAAQVRPAPSVAVPAPPMTPVNSSPFATNMGAPVPAPANLDPRYSPEELSAVFRDLSETLGIKVEKLAVDSSEFPFIIYGRVDGTAGADFFKKINSELRALPGYTYGGSVTGNTSDGATYFALDMTPSSAYPREEAEAIHRRMMIRLQMAAVALQNSPP